MPLQRDKDAAGWKAQAHEPDPELRDAWRRLVVKPGRTGLWQVSGRSDLSWEESLALGLQYVDNWRLSADAVIAGRTLRAVMSARGA